jgi:aspartate aminotransferase-like enzyme
MAAAPKLEQREDYEPASEVTAAYAEVIDFKEKHEEKIKQKIEQALERRRKLIAEFKEATGLNVIEEDANSFLDLSLRDDADKLIECTFKATVKTVEQAENVAKFAKEHRMSISPIAARTSALGVFTDALKKNKLHGGNGVIGIQITSTEKKDEFPADNLELVKNKNTEGYEVIRDSDKPIMILKSCDFPNKPHQVITHGAVYLEDINKFLRASLPHKEYSFRLMPDPTSKKEAQIGGVIATGAQGGNRTQASEDLIEALVVNGDGECKDLQGKAAKNIVGLNGATGICMEACFEVTAFPKYNHGFFIPIKGERGEAWKNSLMLSQKLKKYCQPKNGNPRIQEGDHADGSGTIVTGIELLSRNAIANATSGSNDQTTKEYNDLMKDYDFGIYVTYSSFLDEDDDNFYNQDIFKFLGIEITGNETDEELDENFGENGECLIKNKKEYDAVRVIQNPEGDDRSELGFIDKLRHSVPHHARERARELGGVSESLDFNLIINSIDPYIIEAACTEVAGLLTWYTKNFNEKCFERSSYGHLHPGVGEGGGIDPHIRINLKLSDFDTRYNAPEQVMKMKKLKKELYRRIFALHETNGIEIRSPEKSLLTNTNYLEWMALNQPEKWKEVAKTILEHGYSHNGDGEADFPVFASRVPRDIPGSPAVPGGVQAILPHNLINQGEEEYTKEKMQTGTIAAMDHLMRRVFLPILEISQLSHRGDEKIKPLLKAVNLDICEYLELDEDQFPFFIENPMEAYDIVESNLGKDWEERGYTIRKIPREGEKMEIPLPHQDEKTFYVIDLSIYGIHGMSILISPFEGIKESYDRMLTGENKTQYRNLFHMWCRYPYETEETPNIPAIALLGSLLEEGKGWMLNEEEIEMAKRREIEEVNPFPQKIKTVGPGPSGLHESLMRYYYDCISHGQITSSQWQKEAIKTIREYLGMTEEDDICFRGSATGIMQALAHDLGTVKDKVNVMQIVNDNFGFKFNDILKSAELDVTTVSTPMTTSEDFELDKIVDDLIDSMVLDKTNIIFLTPHKTSTTTAFNPQILIEALRERGKKVGEHYEIVADVTSGVGAIDYSKAGLSGMFASGQKALGCPPGFAFLSLNKRLRKLLPQYCDGYNLYSSFNDEEEGNVNNPLGLALLHKTIEHKISQGQTPEQIAKDTRKKMNMVLGFIDDHRGLRLLVQDFIDQSPILAGIYSQEQNLKMAKFIMSETFASFLGSGYGVFSNESVRVFLANISEEDLKMFLLEFDKVLELYDVAESTRKNSPKVALREAHDVYRTMCNVGENFNCDSIFQYTEALHWVKRLIKTHNANVEIPENVNLQEFKAKRFRMEKPSISPGYQVKATTYKQFENIAMMNKILTLEDEDKKSIPDYYAEYIAHEKTIRKFLKDDPYGKLDRKMALLLEEMQENLHKMATLLKKYADTAERVNDSDRIKWPLVA